MATKSTKRAGGARTESARGTKNANRKAGAAASGLTPLDYMLRILRDEAATPEERRWAAQHAAPYVHPRMANVEHTGAGGGPIQHEDVTNEEIEKEVAERFAAPARAGGADPVVH